MPGRLHTNFRSGNLTEHFGLLLLKGIAAVADVPRPEDLGLDAIATLLRRDSDGSSYAEDSFVVQLKSSSVTSVDYRDHELSWFLAQSEPMFIGIVSRKEARISLYPTFQVNQAVLALHAKQVTAVFCPPEGPYPWSGGSEDSATVSLGPPLLSWTLDDIDDTKWLAQAYSTLKRFLGIVRLEYELLSFGQSSKIEWATNDEGSNRAARGRMMKGHPDVFRSLAPRSIPSLNALLLQAMAIPEDAGTQLTIHLIGVVESLRALGVEVDDVAGVLTQMSVIRLSGQEPKSGGKKASDIGKAVEQNTSDDGS